MSPTLSPAVDSLRTARSRTAGIGERASKARISSTSTVINEMRISTSLCLARRRKTSASRATSGLLVMMPTDNPSYRTSRSSTARVSW